MIQKIGWRRFIFIFIVLVFVGLLLWFPITTRGIEPKVTTGTFFSFVQADLPMETGQPQRPVKSYGQFLQKWDFYWSRYKTPYIIFSFLAIFLGHLVLWLLFGRDANWGSITPCFTPPPNISPAVARVLTYQQFDSNCFTAALLNLEAKGFISISHNKITQQKTDHTGNNRELASEEKAMLRLFFTDKNGEFRYTENPYRIRRFTEKFKKIVLEACGNHIHYWENDDIWWIGVLITLIFGAPLIFDFLVDGQLLNWVLMIPYWYCIFSLFWDSDILEWIFIILDIITPLIFGYLCSIGLINFTFHLKWNDLWLIVFLCLINLFFRIILKAPSKSSKALLAKLQGFKMYLKEPNPEHWAGLNPPAFNQGTFVRYLPYAYALDVGELWASKFSETLTVPKGGPWEPFLETAVSKE